MRIIILFLLISLAFSFNAQTYRVNDQASINAAITQVNAGDTILVENANSPYADINIIIKANGTVDFPIVIKAETLGKVTFTGNSQIQIGGNYIYLEGFSFGGALPPNNLIDNGVIEFRSSTSLSDNCNHCKIKNIKFDSHNQSVAHETEVLKWIRVYGQDNEITNCSFVNKKGVGNCITIERSDPIENRTLIHHNYFANRVPILSGTSVLNDQDAIRVGYSGTSLTDASCRIYNNFFYNWNGEAEIISNKSNKNWYYNNTFRRCVGTLTLRHGTHCEVFGNYFFGENINQSGGVRVIDSDHRIYNNYFQDLNSGSSKVVGAINLFKGDKDFVVDGILSSYAICENNLIANNTLINCNKGIWIGPDDSGREYEPRDLEIVNNIMVDCDQAVLTGTTPPSGTNIIKGNIKKGGNWWSGFNTIDNLSTTLDLAISDGNFARIKQNSQAIGYAYPLSNFSIIKDILEGGRDSDPDSGAEEYGSNGINLPYSLDDVGTKIGVLDANLTGYNMIYQGKRDYKPYPNPAIDELLINNSEHLIRQISLNQINGATIKNYNSITQTREIVIDLNNLVPGIYMVQIIELSGARQTKIFIKE